MNATDLLEAADAIWRERPELRARAEKAWHHGFASGAEWMGEVHGTNDAARPLRDNVLGVAKNGGSALVAAALSAGVYRALRRACGGPASVALAGATFVLGFYAVEGQMVFLFPILHRARAAGHELSFAALLRACRAATVRAGGTFEVMRVVMPISRHMIFGGFLGRGFLRSWCLGCIAVVLWDERVRA